jgi:hypothetical protein
MPYSITTKDGITLQGIPDDVPADAPELKARVAKIRAEMAPPKPTDRQELLSSAPMRLAKGLKDPFDGLAQLAARIPGSEYLNRAADAIGGEGTFLGDVLGIKGATPQQIDADVRDSNAEYEAARAATGSEGMDLARLSGNIVSPVNVTAGKFLPQLRAGAPLKQLAMRGAVGGAAGAITQPVTGPEGRFAAEKTGQAAVGALAGSVLGPAAIRLGESAAKVVDRWRASSGTVKVTPERLRELVGQQLRADGIDVDAIPPSVFDELSNDVRGALAKGKKLDATAALRAKDFEALGVPALQGQLTRNPAQWQREFNLMGVEGVGEPLQDVASRQAQGIQRRMSAAAQGAGEAFDDGGRLIDLGQAAQSIRQGNVRAAYQAFKEATGRELEVPLQGLAQDYADTLSEFGEAVPGAVRAKFEGLGLLTGKQLKGLSIEDAEKLIKTINANTDPKNAVSYRALGTLRKAVEDAISGAAGGDADGAMAAQLAKEARGFAAENFQFLRDTPGLRAAVEGMEPDQFVQRFVTGGKVNEIERLGQAVGPEGKQIMAAQMSKYLMGKAFGANAAGDGKAAQATFNRELQRIGRPKLEALLGKEGAEEMLRIGRVLAYIKQVPEGATPNTSGTGQMVASLVKKAGPVARLPWINDVVVMPLERAADRSAVQQSLAGVPAQAAELDPATLEALSRLFAPVAPAAGAALGYSIR